MSTIIELRLPTDSSFTNLMLYEGIIYLMRETSPQRKNHELQIGPEDLAAMYNNLDQQRIERIRLLLCPHDKEPINKLLKLYKIKIPSNAKISGYNNLINILKKNSNKFTIKQNKITLQLSVGRNVSIGGHKLNRSTGISLQLFKVERYTGITSTELTYSTKQLTTYLSPETLLIGLLGIYSSYVQTVREKNFNYYFLLFDPREIADILNSNKNVENIMNMKNVVRDELAKVIGKHFSEELMIAEILVNVALQDEMVKNRLEKLSLMLVRVAHEGQTYKIYQIIPLTIVKRKFASKVLYDIINPDGFLLSRLSKRDNVEYNNLIMAINGLYRYVILNDQQGLFTMIRELHNAYHKVKSDEKSQKVAGQYRYLLTHVVPGLLNVP